MIRNITLALCATALLATTAIAGSSQNSSSRRSDPNKLICKTFSDTGQKLKRERACHTAAEWRELQRQTRATIERIQNSRPSY